MLDKAKAFKYHKNILRQYNSAMRNKTIRLIMINQITLTFKIKITDIKTKKKASLNRKYRNAISM